VKFDLRCYPIHHFVHVGGYHPATSWPQGGAGIRPNGDERFTTGVEPYGRNWRWDFYSYWMQMRSSPDGKSWGHDFINDPQLKVERGKWICVELMMKMNDPVTESNGEQALWLDGRLWEKDGQIVSNLGQGFPRGKWVWDSWLPDPDGEPFEGFRWRKTEDLKLNFLWLLLYITKAPPGHVSKVWFDDIVVAEQYIGPISSGRPRQALGRAFLPCGWGPPRRLASGRRVPKTAIFCDEPKPPTLDPPILIRFARTSTVAVKSPSQIADRAIIRPYA
jgi:hypothetical protein